MCLEVHLRMRGLLILRALAHGTSQRRSQPCGYLGLLEMEFTFVAEFEMVTT